MNITRNLGITALLLPLILAGPAAGEETVLESLSPGSALSDVRASKGVVFVDLYADW